ncbi:MAG TPA: TMEM43 family protein, partial [Candidatus Gracilibacteria bacterium]|nr:TMEM43 family protein [Candidatus Gracilibacteria bacterium]
NEGELMMDDDEEMMYFDNFEDIAPTLESNKYIFKGFGTLETPEVGDVRISYSVVPSNQQVTAFGQQSGTELSTFVGPKNTNLYRIFSGTHEESLSKMTTEHSQSTWGLRILGFFLMWVSLGMLLGPISTVLDFVPLVGDLSKSVIGIATFIVAAVVSTVVVFVSMILHNIVALILVALLVIGVVVMVLRQKAQSKPSTKS